MEKIIQELSNVYATMQEVEIKGKYTVPYAMCIQALERSIGELNKIKSQGSDIECQTN